MEVDCPPLLELRYDNIFELLTETTPKLSDKFVESVIGSINSHDFKHCKSNERRKYVSDTVSPDKPLKSFSGSSTIGSSTRINTPTSLRASFLDMSSLNNWLFFIRIKLYQCSGLNILSIHTTGIKEKLSIAIACIKGI